MVTITTICFIEFDWGNCLWKEKRPACLFLYWSISVDDSTSMTTPLVCVGHLYTQLEYLFGNGKKEEVRGQTLFNVHRIDSPLSQHPSPPAAKLNAPFWFIDGYACFGRKEKRILRRFQRVRPTKAWYQCELIQAILFFFHFPLSLSGHHWVRSGKWFKSG